MDASTEESSSTVVRTRLAASAPTVLIAVATLVGVVSTLAVWVRTQALDTDEWATVSEELIDDEGVREALSTYLVEQLYEQVDLPEEFGDRLPDAFDGIAGTLAAALRAPLTDAVERAVSTDRFRSVWTTANVAAHSTLVAVLRDETRSGISTADGAVTLELRGLIVSAGEQLGISSERLDRLPADAGSIVIFESDELAAVQRGVQILDVLSWALFVVTIALLVAAVAIARGRRLATLRHVGFAFVGAGVFILLARAIAVRRLVDAVVAEPRNESVAEFVGLTFTSAIGQTAWTIVVWGALIVAFTSLLGTHRWAVATRRFIAPAFAASWAAMIGATVLVLLALLWWSPGRSFDRLAPSLTLVAMVIGAAITLRIRLVDEVAAESVVEDGVPVGGHADDVPAE